MLVTTTRRPWWTRIPPVLLTHPFEVALSIALLAPPARGLLAGAVTPSVDSTLPEVPLAAYQLVSGLAGLMILSGLLTREKWRPGRTLERAGMWMAAGAFIGYGVVVMFALGWVGFVNIVTTLVIGCACVLRALAIRLAEILEYRALKYAARGIDDREVDGE